MKDYNLLDGPSMARSSMGSFKINDSRLHSASKTLINLVFQLIIVGAHSLLAFLPSRISKGKGSLF